MNIIYIGVTSGTSLQRINALKRLGHSVFICNPEDYSFISKKLLYKLLFTFGAVGIVNLINYKMKKTLLRVEADIVWVNGGDLSSPSFIKWLKKKYGFVVNYNNDLPFGNRDKKRWSHYLKSITYYDLLLVRSNTNLSTPIELGAKFTAAMYMLSDEIVHIPQPETKSISSKYRSEVLFVGAWFPERGSFMSDLLKLNVPLTIYGPNWQKAPEWSVIKPFWKGGSLEGTAYTNAIQNSKICLGLVSEENGDLHTRRSIEVPSIGALLCAKRTYEHELMYKEGEEAFFWDDANECAQICIKLLKEEELRKKIALAGMARANKNSFRNESFLRGVLNHIRNKKLSSEKYL